MTKKHKQLGINPSTASHRLVKDILFGLIVETNKDTCHRCKAKLTRDDFSIEHKIDWLDSSDPIGLYFDLKNISFSHKSCNYNESRRNKKYHTAEEVKIAKKVSKKKCLDKLSVKEKKERRRATYLRTGK